MLPDKSEEKKVRSEKKLKRSILTNMIVVPVIPFLIAMGVSFYYFTVSLDNSTRASLKRIVSDHRNMVESFLAERKGDLEFVAGTFDFDQIREEGGINGLLEKLKQKSGAFHDLGLFDSKGIHVRYAGIYQLEGRLYADELWFKEVMQKGEYISDIFLGYRNIPHYVIAVRRTVGERTWVLRTTIDTLVFDRMISQIQIGKTGEAYILNKEGIAQSQRRTLDVRVLEKDPEFSEFPDTPEGIQTFIKTDPGGTQYLYATTWLKSGEWLLVVRQEKKDAYQLLYRAYYIILVILILGCAIIIPVAFFVTERIIKWIEHLDQEKKSLGTQLIRAAQLAEVGEMAAGFAHEINNPLQIMKSEYAMIQTLWEDMTAGIGPERREDLSEIEDCLNQIMLQVNRCSAITQAILKFGRKGESTRQSLNPCQVIPDILRMIEKKAEINGIKVSLRLSEDSPDFTADPSQFQQVILNLLNNAVDAITERHGSEGGTLTIETGRSDEKSLYIDISDNGTGIRPEHLSRLFSPFFTTKPVGKGTGLGLSVCYGIIQGFGGRMEVKSEVNAGTTFRIILPPLK